MSLSLPPTSLIICSRNRSEMLIETVQSVLSGDETPTEVVIVDQSMEPNPFLLNFSTDRPCQVCYIHSRTNGLSRARNIGIKFARYDILLFIDDDMRVEANWFTSLVQSLINAGPVCVVTGKVLPGEAEIPGGFTPAIVIADQSRSYQGRINQDVLAAGNMAFYRSTYAQVGPFDESLGAGAIFSAADDNDYGFRLLEAGFQIRYTPDAVIYHRAWRTQSEFFKMRVAYGRGKGGFYGKYLKLNDMFIFKRMMMDIGLRLVRFPWRFYHHPRLALGDLAYIYGILTGLGVWWFGRRMMSMDTPSYSTSTERCQINE